MNDSQAHYAKLRVPGGKTVTSAKAFCAAWRAQANSVASFIGWAIHSFGSKNITLVSKDYSFTQPLSPQFVEDLFATISSKATLCSRCSVLYSSAASMTQLTPLVSPPPSITQNTTTSDSKMVSSAQAPSSSHSPMSSNSKPSPKSKRLLLPLNFQKGPPLPPNRT